jgi:chemotaxis family two-component system response regulator Rcp1
MAHGPRILLIEDNSGDVALFREALKLECSTADLEIIGDGEAAADYLFAELLQQPDLIFLDLNLPRRSGLEILSLIKANAKFSTVPVIVTTSAIVRPEITRAYQHGANCVITKPFDLESYLSFMSLTLKFWCAVTAHEAAG